MFEQMGHRNAPALDAMTAAFLPWLRQRVASAEYLSWLALAPDGAIVAGLGLWLMDCPPHMLGPGAPRGSILNVYTEPVSRRQGIARRLMNVALDWCRANRVRAVILHASEELGFKSTNEMRILLDLRVCEKSKAPTP
jgi:GNAT superfamily N-acetyltransferase